MMTIPAANDEGYLQFVVSLLDESDYARSRSGSIIADDHNKMDDFLTCQTEFMMRDRAFSWDLGFEDQLHADAQVVAEQLKSRKRSNSIFEIKKAIEDAERMSRLEHVSKKLDIKEDLDDMVSLSGSNGTPSTNLTPSFLTNQLLPVPTVVTADMEPVDSNNMRIGAYTKQERQIIIERFRAKKKRRVWRKQIKYDCRKRLADTRPRVKGRFVSRKEREAKAATDQSSDAESESTHHDDDSVDGGGGE